MEDLVPYLFDRLYSPPGSIPQSQGEIEQSIVRDIVWLLNSKAPGPEDPQPTRVQRSVLGFGLADLTGRPITTETKNRVVEHVRDALTWFEPRIDPNGLIVRLAPQAKTTNDGIISLEVKATIHLQGNPDRGVRLQLRTTLDLLAGWCSVDEQRTQGVGHG